MSGKLLDGKRLKQGARLAGRSFAEAPAPAGCERPALITGGSGFIGTNLAHRLLSDGEPVLLYDNFSRPGVERNARWLRELHRNRLRIETGDVRDVDSLRRAVRQAGSVFHFAAQVAVTTSLVDPGLDFEVNAQGTLNVLEALRALENPVPLVFTSTNKVYGGLSDLKLRRNSSRYEPLDAAALRSGIDESRPLDFQSPYGCSKGAADQYVIDYARTFGMRTAVFRMSCIYGPHQFGTEDQGWVAHFLSRAIEDRTITLYGDGMQVRDLLFVEDLVDALLLARENIDRIAGQAFNIGGGPENTVSLLELLGLIREIHGRKPPVERRDWRAGDQRYYVSSFEKFNAATGWRPETGVGHGVEILYHWLRNGYRVSDGGYRREPLTSITHIGYRASGVG